MHHHSSISNWDVSLPKLIRLLKVELWKVKNTIPLPFKYRNMNGSKGTKEWYPPYPSLWENKGWNEGKVSLVWEHTGILKRWKFDSDTDWNEAVKLMLSRLREVVSSRTSPTQHPSIPPMYYLILFLLVLPFLCQFAKS